jgi:hypothetical protein
LCRALVLAAERGYTLLSLVLGLKISFASNLDEQEQSKMSDLLVKHFGKLANPPATGGALSRLSTEPYM